MVAAHDNLYDIFPGENTFHTVNTSTKPRAEHVLLLAYGMAAALLSAALTDPRAPELRISLNCLILHVFLKVFIYVPAYILDQDVLRSFSHIFAVSCIITSLWNML
jgi:uncharacterized MAPEG superfamily protein